MCQLEWSSRFIARVSVARRGSVLECRAASPFVREKGGRVSFDRPSAVLEPLTPILSPCSKGRGERTPPSLAGRITRDPMSNCGSHGDLAEYAAQFVKIHRLGKMEIEPGFSAALDVVARGKTRESYGFKRSFSFRFGN